MKNVIKKSFISMLVAMMMGLTIILNYSNAADVKDEVEGVLTEENPIKKVIDENKAKHPELNAGYGMKYLNRAPRVVLSKGEKGKVNVAVKDGSGIATINATNMDTKKAKKEVALKKEEKVKEHLVNFDEPKKNKVKKMEYVLKDHDGLTSKVQCKVRNTGKEYKFNVSMRVTFSYNKGKLNILLRDNAGINEGKAAIEIIDKNAKNKSLGVVKGKDMKLIDRVKYNKKIVYGIYQIDINKLAKGKDGKYFINVRTTDADGFKGYRMAKFMIDETK